MRRATVIAAAAGLGKSSEVAKRIAKSRARFEVYAPTHRLAEEWAASIRKINNKRRVVVIGGRGHMDAKGHPLCARNPEAEIVTRSGLPVFTTMCEWTDAKGNRTVCPFYQSCGYINQFRAADVLIYTHAHLVLKRSRLNSQLPDFVVIDESFFQNCLRITETPLATLLSVAATIPGDKVLVEIHNAQSSRVPLLQHLRQQQLVNELPKTLRKLRAGIRKAARQYIRTGPKNPQMAPQVKDLAPVIEMLQALLHEISQARSDSQTVILDQQQRVVIHRKLPIERFGDESSRTWLQAPTPLPSILIIDANASKEIISEFFKVPAYSPMTVQRNAHVTQCITTRGSKTSFVPARNTSPDSRRSAAKRVSAIQKLINRKAKAGIKVLVVGPQEVTGNAGKGTSGLLKYPPGVESTHFGGFRGIDRWKLFDCIIVIGRNQPSTQGVEALARALWGADHDLNLGCGWIDEKRAYRTDSGREVGVDVSVHPDRLVQIIVEQIREAESLQAIDRLRLLWAKSPKEVILLSNIPLDITVNELLSWEDITLGSPFAEALAHCGGTLPLTPKWLTKKFPRLWKTERAAKDDVQKVDKEAIFTNRLSISKSGLFEHKFRPVGQKVDSRFISTLADHKAALAALQDVMGMPLVGLPAQPASAVLGPSSPGAAVPAHRPRHSALRALVRAGNTRKSSLSRAKHPPAQQGQP